MISEPMTLVTDYLLAAAVLFFGWRLLRSGLGRAERSVVLWAAAFAASAVAALAGGTYHGFHPAMDPAVAHLLWKGTVLSVGGASFFLLSATATALLCGPPRRMLHALAAVKFLLYAGWMLFHDAFIYVILDYGASMMIVLLLQIPGLHRREGARWTAAGILLSFAAAGIQASGVRLHELFNHNDLYHVVQIGAFYLLYRGGLLLKDACRSVEYPTS